MKFVDSTPQSKYLRAAIYYLYITRRHDRLIDYCNDCLDAGGTAVPRDRILKVELPAYESGASSASKIALNAKQKTKASGKIIVETNVSFDPDAQ